MREVVRFAVQALTTTLGSVGQGTATEIPNFLQQSNGAGFGPAISPAVSDWSSSAFVAKTTGKLLLVGQMTAGAQAAGQNISFHLSMDGTFLPLVAEIATSGEETFGLSSGGFPATVTLVGVVSVVVGASHTYGIQCVNLHVGQTTIISAGLANILIYELP